MQSVLAKTYSIEETNDFLNSKKLNPVGKRRFASLRRFYKKLEAGEDLEKQKKYEKDDLQKRIEELKKERRKLPLQAQTSLNSEISKLKDKQLKLDEEIAKIGRESRERETQKQRGNQSDNSHRISRNGWVTPTRNIRAG